MMKNIDGRKINELIIFFYAFNLTKNKIKIFVVYFIFDIIFLNVRTW